MSYIKTWVERCDEHPDHQSGLVSNGMIQARMQEEIDDLREENEMLIVTVTMIERMAAGAIYSQEAIHASAIGALKQLGGKP